MGFVWRKPEVNEALVVLYLRLNGYFTTGLVIHDAEWGANRTEIDCLAVRHPGHEQPDRGVACSKFLRPSSEVTDLLICEVKSSPDALAFNPRLRADAEVLRRVLLWAGVFHSEQLDALVTRLQPLLQGNVEPNLAEQGVSEGGVRVRALLCCPPSVSDVPGVWALHGGEILDFVMGCFTPAEPRDGCSTRYNFKLWGSGLAPLVAYFKNVPPDEKPTLDRLYASLGAV